MAWLFGGREVLMGKYGGIVPVEILERIREERHRQNEKWGPQHHPAAIWALILGEEVGEVMKAALEGQRGGMEWDGVGWRARSYRWRRYAWRG